MANRVAIYGGAFNPPHHGHTATISNVLNSGAADSVIVVPSGTRPDKSYQVSADHRLEMVQLLVAHEFPGVDAVQVSDVQVRSVVGYATVDLMHFFAKARPESKLSFVIGAELLEDLSTWKESEKLKAEVSFLVVPRLGRVTGTTPVGFNVDFIVGLEETSVAISSTRVRQLLGKRGATGGFLSRPVAEYAMQHMLYQNAK